MHALKNIVLVDRHEGFSDALGNILQYEFSVTMVPNGHQALEELKNQRKPIAAVLLGSSTPQEEGLQFLKMLQADTRYDNLPVLVISNDRDMEMEAFQCGAWDFISAPYDEQIIKFRLHNIIERSQLGALKKLQYISEHDALTGLYNKTKFFEVTHEMLMEHQDKQFVFWRFDINRFQLVHSFFGTEEGDKLIAYIASLLKKYRVKNRFTTIARIEGDVFAVCAECGDSSELDMVQEIQRTREQLMSFNSNYDLVLNFGAYLVTDHEMSVELMYDNACLAAKSCKGNYVQNYAFYTPEMTEVLMREQDITNDMNTALAEGQFQVWLQPQFDMVSGRVAGAEALVRWLHPDRGLISPGEFIPVFERNGFISKLDYYIWEQVCILLRRWLDEGYVVLPISVNVSRVNIYSPMFVRNISNLVEKYDIPTELFHLEVTESAYTDNPVALVETIDVLHQKGFQIYMDDFGSGYSSLNMLKDLDIDVLKIDMNFLRSIRHKGRGENIVSAVVRMAKWLNLPVVIEGVETAEQASMLKSIGCDYAQGYFYAKPMPVAAYEKLVASKEIVLADQTFSREEGFQVDYLWAPDAQVNLLFNSLVSGVGIYEYDGTNVELIRANNGYYQVTGCDASLFAKKSVHILDVVEETDRPLILDSLKRAMETDKAVDCIYRRHRIEGETLWIQARIRYILSKGGRHLFYGAISDITAQKKAEELARKEEEKRLHMEERYRIALQDTDITIWEYDLKQGCILQTEKSRDQHGFDMVVENVPESLIESGYIHPECVEEFRKMHVQLFAGAKSAAGDFKMRTVDRKGWWWERIKYTTVFDQEGNPVSAVAVSHDVTKEKEMEEDLRRRA